MHTLEYDARTRILHIRVEGFWTLPMMTAFTVKLLAYATAVKLRHGEFATLVDTRNFPVQSPEVIKAVEYLSAKGSAISSAPTATVVSSQLSKMQAERALTADHIRIFRDWEAAVAWLDEVWVNKAARAA